MPVPRAHAALELPKPGTMVSLSPAFQPVLLKGLKVDPKNPFRFDFIVDTGDSPSLALKEQSSKLIKYFLASLTIPEKDLWVNLSPYEKDRMIADNLGQTQMGQDMLAQDYILKQLTASLIYPEKDLGKAFWDKVYAKAQQMYGTTEIPVNTFNKVWIVADKADVFERGNVAYIVGAHLKIMLEEDYKAKGKNQGTQAATVSSQIVKDIILPAIEEEVNKGKNFAPLRQMFYSMILASWYKMALKDALLTQLYGNQSKVNVGINAQDPTDKDKIFEQYLQAYKKGVFNYIKEDINQATQQPTPRKYFSGGTNFSMLADQAMLHRIITPNQAQLKDIADDHDYAITVTLAPGSNPDAAMSSKEKYSDHPWPINTAFSEHEVLKTIAMLEKNMTSSSFLQSGGFILAMTTSQKKRQIINKLLSGLAVEKGPFIIIDPQFWNSEEHAKILISGRLEQYRQQINVSQQAREIEKERGKARPEEIKKAKLVKKEYVSNLPKNLVDQPWSRDKRFLEKDVLDLILIMEHMLADPMFIGVGDWVKNGLVLAPSSKDPNMKDIEKKIISLLIRGTTFGDQDGFWMIYGGLQTREELTKMAKTYIKEYLIEAKKEILKSQQKAKEEKEEVEKAGAVQKAYKDEPFKEILDLPWEENEQFTAKEVLMQISIIEHMLKEPLFITLKNWGKENGLVISPLNSKNEDAQEDLLFYLLEDIGVSSTLRLDDQDGFWMIHDGPSSREELTKIIPTIQYSLNEAKQKILDAQQKEAERKKMIEKARSVQKTFVAGSYKAESFSEFDLKQVA